MYIYIFFEKYSLLLVCLCESGEVLYELRLKTRKSHKTVRSDELKALYLNVRGLKQKNEQCLHGAGNKKRVY